MSPCLFNTSLQHVASTRLFNTPLQDEFPIRLFNTAFQHGYPTNFTRCLCNVFLKHFFDIAPAAVRLTGEKAADL